MESKIPSVSEFTLNEPSQKESQKEFTTNLSDKIVFNRSEKSSPTKKLFLTKEERKILDTEHEVERVQMGVGQCFGEWGLIYNIPRTASALALEDTILFAIEKDEFDKSLSVRYKIY